MTSEEALKKIYNTGANMVIGTPLDNFFKEEVKAIAKDLNAVRIISEDSDLISYIKDYYENMWTGIHDENDVNFMKQWSNEAYKNGYRQNK